MKKKKKRSKGKKKDPQETLRERQRLKLGHIYLFLVNLFSLLRVKQGIACGVAFASQPHTHPLNIDIHDIHLSSHMHEIR